MIRNYQANPERLLRDAEEGLIVRWWVGLSIWDAKNGKQSDKLRDIRVCLESVGKWMDELPVSVLLR